MLTEHRQAVLQIDLPESGLKAGDVGTVVHIYRSGEAYEMEFITLDGRTAAVVTVEASDVRAVSPGEIPHARRLEPAHTGSRP